MTDSQTVIYPPPRRGLPHLVVTISKETVVAHAAASKLEARALATKDAMGKRHSRENGREKESAPAKEPVGSA
jgi:hypothetical protein